MSIQRANIFRTSCPTNLYFLNLFVYLFALISTKTCLVIFSVYSCYTFLYLIIYQKLEKPNQDTFLIEIKMPLKNKRKIYLDFLNFKYFLRN